MAKSASRISIPLLILSLSLTLILPATATHAVKYEANFSKDRVAITIDGKLFTNYIFKGWSKPICHPIIGPHQTPMTRNYPITKARDGEAKDHPHHASLWYTHGSVNGISFWHNARNTGKIIHQKFTKKQTSTNGVTLQTLNHWNDSKGKTICTDTTEIKFHKIKDAFAIDYAVTIHASHGHVTFGDTKEGSMGIRTHPALRLKGKVAKGKAQNSEGHKNRDLWGKRAKWVDYWGPINGKTVGIAIFDHPQNPRYPTWWHARDYGLVAANAFGVHNFERKKRGTGDFKIKSGSSTTFKFRFLFHPGDVNSAKVAEHFEQWARTK